MGNRISLALATIHMFVKKQEAGRHACLMLKKSLFVPHTLEKLFRNSSSMWKYDPCHFARVIKTLSCWVRPDWVNSRSWGWRWGLHTSLCPVFLRLKKKMSVEIRLWSGTCVGETGSPKGGNQPDLRHGSFFYILPHFLSAQNEKERVNAQYY